MAGVAGSAQVQYPKIHHLPANSSFIASFEFDEQNLCLTTWMKSGAVYQHRFFLPQNWEALKTSQDHSKHWSRNVVGKHASVKVIARRSPTAEIKRRKSK